MSTPVNVWLVAADAVLGRDDCSEVEVDRLLEDGLLIDAATGKPVDPVRLERVLAVLRARRATLATELADLSRRRSDLLRAQSAATEYLNATDSVPMV